MAQQLGQVAVGSIVKINENGSPVNYIVANQGKPSSSYDSSCDGTWLLRQDIAENRVWDSGNSNVLESSDIQSYLNNTWINRYDTDIRNAIKQVKIPYRQNGGSGGTDRNGANGLSCKIFLLSGYEVGWTTSNNPNFPVDGAKLSYFTSGDSSSAKQKRIAKLNGSAANWWLRSPYISDTRDVRYVTLVGDRDSRSASTSCGVRPALILPTNLTVLDDNTVLAPPIPPATLTVPAQSMQGNQIAVSWSAVDSADGYILERKSDTDADWTQVYSGANTSFEETVGTWTSVQYRVKAGVSGIYGDYTTSASVPVVSASALVISGTDEDLGTLTADVPYTISSDTGNPITLTRTVNGNVVATLTVQSGFAYTIPVMDLPTGSGTIEISATVNTTSGGPASATRTWTYQKTAITFPNGASVGQLNQNGANVFPATLAEAVKVPENWGGTLDKALELLYDAANSAVISVGTYEGSGTFGADNPNTLTISPAPQVVTIYGGGQTLVISSTDTSSPAYINGTTVKWYSTVSAADQMNTDGVTYSYVAVAKGVTT